MNPKDLEIIRGSEEDFRVWVFSTLQEIRHLLEDGMRVESRVARLEKLFWTGTGIAATVAIVARWLHV